MRTSNCDSYMHETMEELLSARIICMGLCENRYLRELGAGGDVRTYICDIYLHWTT